MDTEEAAALSEQRQWATFPSSKYDTAECDIPLLARADVAHIWQRQPRRTLNVAMNVISYSSL